MRFGIKAGIDLRLAGAVESDAIHPQHVDSVAVLGRDFPGIRFDLPVEQGRAVRAGEVLLRDRHRPEVVFTSPIAGTLGSINRGARRSLVSLTVISDGSDAAISFDVAGAADGAGMRRLMLQAGLWPAVRTRPFGRIADPDGEPKALLVTALDTEPLAPDPTTVIAAHTVAFRRGLQALTMICDAPRHLCVAAHSDLARECPEGFQVAEFHGPHPAGLPGVHIHTLCPIGFDGREVWHISYQDVIALGVLMETGRPWQTRVVSFAGPAVAAPRLVELPLGAALDELTDGALTDEGARVISGSVLSGHAAWGTQAYLGRYDRQVTALPEASGAEPPRRGVIRDTQRGGHPGPLIPTGDLERVAPPGILPVPLLRSLLVGDVDRARDLGALELVEEDMMLLSYVCSSKSDYGALLRRVLDQLHGEAS